jgi:hypothetical protein
MPAPSDETQPVRRGRIAAISRDVRQTGGTAFSRMGFTDPALVLRWREIAGAEVARLCQPLRFSEGAGGGILTLKALPGAALFLGHESRALTARINQFLGRPAVARLKFVQGAFVPPAPAPRIRRAAPALNEKDPANAYAGPEKLKAALLHLARWRESGQKCDKN